MDYIFSLIHMFVYYFLPLVAVLGIMIFFHELGHFLVAKYFGVTVQKFALGFGPKLVAKTLGDTEYSIRYFPLGGFVKMLGEDPTDEETRVLSSDEEEAAFNNKHAVIRIAIVAAGPLFNLALALVLFCGLYLFVGISVMAPEIGQVREGSPGHRAGLEKGDIIVSVEGKKIEGWSEIREAVQAKGGNPLVITVERNDRLISMTVIPEESSTKNEFGEDVRSFLIGIVGSGQTKVLEVGPWQAARQGVLETWKWIKLTCVVIAKLFQGVVSIKTLGGPVLIGQMTGQLAQENLSYLIPFMAIISVNLGILNLFPIPILDGGLIVFLLTELLLGRPVSLKTREIAQKVGLALLIFLMLFVTYNDLSRIFG
ncbi:MAG: RIP metalloprotease RseP [Thermodesulfobacteriota bacterium]|nr:RIP metalloprotease RseP [Thermodesulfobacteriota bacterium]